MIPLGEPNSTGFCCLLQKDNAFVLFYPIHLQCLNHVHIWRKELFTSRRVAPVISLQNSWIIHRFNYLVAHGVVPPLVTTVLLRSLETSAIVEDPEHQFASVEFIRHSVERNGCATVFFVCHVLNGGHS